MSTRMWPAVTFGKLPNIDCHIIRHDENKVAVGQRYQVDNKYFKNMTLAREYVVKMLGMSSTLSELCSMVQYDIAQRRAGKAKVDRPAIANIEHAHPAPVVAPAPRKISFSITSPTGYVVQFNNNTEDEVDSVMSMIKKHSM